MANFAGRRYSDLFDFAPVTYLLLDPIGVVLTINLAGCRLLHAQRAQIVGCPLVMFVVRGDRGELLEHLRRCRTSETPVETELRLTTKDGRVATCRLHTQRARYERRPVFPTVVIDQTEHRRLDDARLEAERQSERAQREAAVALVGNMTKDRLLAAVSHELRTPLTPALIASTRLLDLPALPDNARSLATMIKRNIELEARLIDDLLDVVRIERNRLNLKFEVIDLHRVLQEAISICQSAARDKGITIHVHVLAEAHHVKGDEARLRQIFWNLLTNAIKYTNADGNVVVRSADTAGRHIRITIRDDGVGMDARLIESLFAPFERQPLRESRSGLGLGLTICKGIVSAHGGQISAASNGPGQGSTFEVELATVQAGESDARRRSDARTLPARSRTLRILLVEDDEDSSEMLGMFLRQMGHEVEIASSLGDGLSRLKKRWDIVLSDIGLPDGSGLELARRVRRLPSPPSQLIAFSGYGAATDLKASRRAGFTEHFVKPIDLDKLGALLAQPPAPDPITS